MQCRKWPFILTQLKIARLRTLWAQTAALTYLEVGPPQQGQVFLDQAHMQTGQGCRRQAAFIVLKCCKECQDQKTKLKCCRCLENHGPKGNTVWGAFRRQWGRWEMPSKVLNSCKTVFRSQAGAFRVQSLLQIQKYQSETVGRLTEQCRMRCQEPVDNTWLSTSFTLCASSARCQHRARNHSAPRQRASGCHSTWTVSREGEFNWVFLFWDTQRCTCTYYNSL